MVTADAAESQMIIARKTEQGVMQLAIETHLLRLQAIRLYVPSAITRKTTIKSMVRDITGQTNPFRMPLVVSTASETPSTFHEQAVKGEILALKRNTAAIPIARTALNSNTTYLRSRNPFINK